MTELTTKTDNLHPLVKLRVGQKSIKDLDENTVKRECVGIITRSFTYSTPNGVTDPQIIQFQSLELFRMLKAPYNTLTLKEVAEAFLSGLNGAYGPYFGMCGKTYNQFIKGFFDNPQRGKEWNSYLNGLDKPKTLEVPEHIKIDQSKEGLKKRFKHYKETGDIGYCAWYAYDLLKGFLNVKSLVTKEQFVTLLKEVEPTFTSMIKGEKSRAELSGEHSYAEALGKILVDGVVNYKPCQQRIKERSLKLYFDSVEGLGI